MKTRIEAVLALALTSAAMLAITSCSSEPKEAGGPGGEGALIAALQPGEAGGVAIGTYQETASVTAIDKVNRKVTLTTADGDKATFKAGPEVVNFDQIQVGDRVKATVTRQLAVFVANSGEATTQGSATAVALAPEGAKPGVMVADATQVTAKVTSLNLKSHEATLQFADGKSKTFKARPDVDLTKYSVGQDVVIRITDAVAITVEKP
jgi:hypothetical protein